MKNIEINFIENPKIKSIKIFNVFDLWLQQGSMIITDGNRKTFHIDSVHIKNIDTRIPHDCMEFRGFYKYPGKGYYPVSIKINIDIKKI